MKRLFLALALALAAAALASGAGTAKETQGPPCANITGHLQTDYYDPAANPDLQWTFVLQAPSCESVRYDLKIYSFGGETLLDTVTQNGNGSTSLIFNYNFTGTAPEDGVCIAGETYFKDKVRPDKDHLADVAPDSGCIPVELGGAGGGEGFG
jgi:hypothetical protein